MTDLNLTGLAAAIVATAAIIVIAMDLPPQACPSASPSAEYVLITTQDNATYAAALTPHGEVPPRACWREQP